MGQQHGRRCIRIEPGSETEAVMRIYTRTGDQGETGVLGPGRVSKHAPRIEAYGTVDELNAALGLVLATGPPARVAAILEHAQPELMVIGAELATPSPEGAHYGTLKESHVLRLEEMIDLCEADLPPLHHFVLPGGTPSAAALHLARGVCRRAERRVVELIAVGENVSPTVLAYLNRLSDLLFVLARSANAAAGVPDVPWVKAQD
jgi:cob(I)alamin adenosyltransferase